MRADDPTERAALVHDDHVTAKEPGEPIGPCALIGIVFPAALSTTHLIVANDGTADSVHCARLFASSAIHGVIPANRDWQKITVLDAGTGTVDPLIQAAQAMRVPGAMFTAAADGRTELRLYAPDGTLITEETGLAALRQRLTKRIPLPVNESHRGQLIDRRDLFAPQSD